MNKNKKKLKGRWVTKQISKKVWVSFYTNKIEDKNLKGG